MSTLLCSFLLGVGYNAYVVAGYAPRDVTLNRQVNNVCPILKRDMLEEKPSRSDAETEQLAQQQDEGEGEGEGDGMEDVGMEEVIGIEPVTAKYVIKETPPLTSQYQAALQQEERDRRAAEATEASAAW